MNDLNYQAQWRAKNPEKARGYSARWRTQNPEKARESQRRWREKNPEKVAAKVRAWADANPDRVRANSRKKNLWTKFKLTPEQYDAKFEAQSGLCATCRRPETLTLKGTLCHLAVDHDRRCCPGDVSCGKCVRDLLCSKCNKAVGLLDEVPARARAVASYLEKWGR